MAWVSFSQSDFQEAFDYLLEVSSWKRENQNRQRYIWDHMRNTWHEKIRYTVWMRKTWGRKRDEHVRRITQVWTVWRYRWNCEKKIAKLKLHEMPTAVFKMISSASEWYAVSSPRLPCTQRSCAINRWIFGQNWPGLSEQHLSPQLLTAVKKYHWFLTPYLLWQSIKTRSGNYTKCHILHPIWSILGPSIQAQHGAFFSGRGQELKVLA